MLITSRSYEEYRSMFDLADGDLDGGVVDVSAGGSSFVAECGRRGLWALAVDPVYAEPLGSLAEAVRAAVTHGHDIIAANPDRFVWSYYGDIEQHRRVRERAGATFLADRETPAGRYVAGSLPHLPLRDRTFDLVVCSHLLFTWSDRFDAGWHRAALRELVRVARREVRIFPLVTAGTGEAVGFLPDVVAHVQADGVRAEFRRVPYEFQRGADTMLVLARPGVT